MSLFSCSEADAQGANSPRTVTIKGESSALQEKCEEEKSCSAVISLINYQVVPVILDYRHTTI